MSPDSESILPYQYLYGAFQVYLQYLAFAFANLTHIHISKHFKNPVLVNIKSCKFKPRDWNSKFPRENRSYHGRRVIILFKLNIYKIHVLSKFLTSLF